MKHERKLFLWMRQWLKANGYNWPDWHYVKNTVPEVVLINSTTGEILRRPKEVMMRNENNRRTKRRPAAGSDL
ncbi:MAG TPA: hypothetical protein VEG39_10945 [Clostridia bacterium]|nr:hypothetical protein [Clostridia bacterium]